MIYKKQKDVILLSIGRELLRGKTRDSDGPFLARRLSRLGLRVRGISVLDDEEKEIAAGVREALRRRPAYVFTTGGLGPTFDDMTLRSIARSLRRRLALNREALQMVRRYYLEMKRRRVVSSATIGPARRKMALLPERSRPLPNPCGAAPGVEIQEGATTIFCLPGVPPEMKGIFLRTIAPRLRWEARGESEAEIPLQTKDESLLVPLVARIRKRFPEVYVKSRVRGAEERIRIVVTLHGADRRRVAKAAEALRRMSAHLR